MGGKYSTSSLEELKRSLNGLPLCVGQGGGEGKKCERWGVC